MKDHSKERLALDGGEPAVKTSIPRRKRHGEAEKRLLDEVIDSDILFFFLGTKVKEFERQFAAMYGKKYCVACSSGTAAVHLAVASLELPPGSEVITSAITDMGSLTGLLYQGLVPVFADVEPDTLNMDPASVERCITPRTRAMMAVHHGGLASDLDSLSAISERYGLPLIEDCAQAYGCRYKKDLVGGRGTVNSFSLNHFKHISAGSGGMIVTDDDHLRYIASLFLDKCYQREEGIRNPFFLAPNYQMTELQGAVALAQLERLSEFISRRHDLATRLSDRLTRIPGIGLPRVRSGSKHSYFLYLMKLDLEHLNCSAEQFANALRAEGVNAKAHLITGGRPVYLYDIFQRQSAFPGSRYPFVSADTGANRSYPRGLCPVAEDAFSKWLVLELLENYTETNVDEMANAVEKVACHFATGAAESGHVVSGGIANA